MAKRGGKGKRLLAWCWYCDREFDDEKVLILHQKAKHFKCLYCPRRLNSASGLVVHIAQIHKESIEAVPNSIAGHDSPEIEIFGMQGVPPEDIQRHYDGQPMAPHKKSTLGEAGLVSLLAAQKAATSGNPLPMSIHVPLKQVQIIEGIGPSQAIPRLPGAAEGGSLAYPVFPSPLMNAPAGPPPITTYAPQMPAVQIPAVQIPAVQMPAVQVPPEQFQPPLLPQLLPLPLPQQPLPPQLQQPPPHLQQPPPPPPQYNQPTSPAFTPIRIDSFVDQKSGKRQPTSFVMIADACTSPDEKRASLSKYKLAVDGVPVNKP